MFAVNSRQRWRVALLLLCVGLEPLGLAALNIESRYSPLNSRREIRSSTRYIILHTTEGGGKGSLDKLRKYGEAHYMVDRDGKVTRIIQHNRIAMHAGRSMWSGQTNIDRTSIGIEVVGYHNKPITRDQKLALRELLRQLQGIYKIPDSRVLPHSMVAYGRPNRWHTHSHRGRKRCGMLMAREDLRAELGLTAKPSFDPDVRAGRLVVADPYLEKVLYGSVQTRATPTPRPAAQRTVSPAPVAQGDNVIARGRSAWDIAREQYKASTTIYTFPDGSVKRGNQITDWNRMPAGTRVTVSGDKVEQKNEVERVQVLGRDGSTAGEIAGDAVQKSSTIYFFPDGRVKQGNQMTSNDFRRMPKGTGMLVGYTHGGVISSRRNAFDICGPRWNLSTTFYRTPDGKITSGDQMDERNIANGTMVFFQP
jgi:hypothetical protein